jgi:hypothetical protein
MAKFKDSEFDPNAPVPGQPAANLGTQITNLLAHDPYSVEVFRVSDSKPLVLRLWLSRHCDSATHEAVGPKLGP